jgi:hypothetical protein
VACFYRYAEQEGLIGISPAAHVRRPRLDYESHAAGLDRNEVRVRLLGSTKASKNDPNDALATAIAGLRHRGLRAVPVEDHTGDPDADRPLRRLVALRTQAACRLHVAQRELIAGGAPRRLGASRAAKLLRNIDPQGADGVERKHLALELLADLRRLDRDIAGAKRRVSDAVTASGTSLLEHHGVGPIVAGFILGHVGDPARFLTPERLASPWISTVQDSPGSCTAHPCDSEPWNSPTASHPNSADAAWPPPPCNWLPAGPCRLGSIASSWTSPRRTRRASAWQSRQGHPRGAIPDEHRGDRRNSQDTPVRQKLIARIFDLARRRSAPTIRRASTARSGHSALHRDDGSRRASLLETGGCG